MVGKHLYCHAAPFEADLSKLTRSGMRSAGQIERKWLSGMHGVACKDFAAFNPRMLLNGIARWFKILHFARHLAVVGKGSSSVVVFSRFASTL